MTFTLAPLDADETRQLIQFRLRQAGAGRSAPVFDDDAVRVIHVYSEGSPRVIVTLCRNALLIAAQLKTRRINEEIILHTIDKTMLPDDERRMRAAQAMERRPEQPATPPEAPAAPARLNADEERANQLLLRMSKARQSQSQSTTVNEL
jgi:hypothetical protein